MGIKVMRLQRGKKYIPPPYGGTIVIKLSYEGLK